MLINGIDISTLGLKLYDRVLTTNSVSTSESWLDGDIQPTFVRQQDRFKSIKLSFLVLTSNEEEAFMKISKLTSMLRKASVKFDDLDLTFDVTMQGAANEDRLKNGNFVVTYNFNSDYARGEREIYTTNANATNSFKLTVLYYQNNTQLIQQESVSLRAGQFDDNSTLASLGIDVNKYKPDYYDDGTTTNLNGLPITFENLQGLQTLIVNYTPTKYNLTVTYFMDTGTGTLNETLSQITQFTYPKVLAATSISQIVDAKTYKPDGYSTVINYDGALTVEDLLKASPIYVFYTKVESPQAKEVVVNYQEENDDGEFETIQSQVMVFKETDFIAGMQLKDIFNLDAYRPDTLYYNAGYLDGKSENDEISFETLETTYTIKYKKSINTIYVEYYVGVYPEWYRLSAIPIQTKYLSSYEDSFKIEDLGIDPNKYHTATYKDGKFYNGEEYDSYLDALTAGVIQVYYEPIDYTIAVRYYKGTEQLATEEIVVNELTFINNPTLGEVVKITQHRPEGW
jgi:hypothetical protein